jgi:hypothetical protein
MSYSRRRKVSNICELSLLEFIKVVIYKKYNLFVFLNSNISFVLDDVLTKNTNPESIELK